MSERFWGLKDIKRNVICIAVTRKRCAAEGAGVTVKRVSKAGLDAPSRISEEVQHEQNNVLLHHCTSERH